MTPRRVLLFSLIPLLASCQMFQSSAPTPQRTSERFQGEVARIDGQLLFRPCGEQRRFLIVDEGASGFEQDAQGLGADLGARLFADLRGQLGSSTVRGVDGQLTLDRLYRLQGEGHGCEDLNFRRQLLRASGHEPGWTLSINNQGMLLERPGQPAQALPYLEETLPEGGTNFSSEANTQRIELWVAPQRCVDSASGTVSHLSAQLRLDGEVLRGCAYHGGARP
ncbi:hypothetical protein DN826_02475 [Stutzerimonas nosocomialis]|uniref:Lipoprotein n=1 Tax=Stutzerimonas nosocomialis TaxID=1056496 RepID=A0A5R9QED7_9GAMM|nr:hypothetical protein [Stutzerimonas nosocomialis]TLX59677.1 hypothetical protein DN826_02475 [Stutzerimonas nosocomialis]TLX63499.1 hypothetical protein DN820_10405 [Stutzerimonas nosocomialis]